MQQTLLLFFLSQRYQISHDKTSALTSKETLIFHIVIMHFGYKDLCFNTRTQEQVQIQLVLYAIGLPLFLLLRFTTLDSRITVGLSWLVMRLRTFLASKILAQLRNFDPGPYAGCYHIVLVFDETYIKSLTTYRVCHSAKLALQHPFRT